MVDYKVTPSNYNVESVLEDFDLFLPYDLTDMSRILSEIIESITDHASIFWVMQSCSPFCHFANCIAKLSFWVRAFQYEKVVGTSFGKHLGLIWWPCDFTRNNTFLKFVKAFCQVLTESELILRHCLHYKHTNVMVKGISRELNVYGETSVRWSRCGKS